MLKWPRLQCPFYTNMLHGKMVSLRGNKCAQIYVTTFGFVAAHPIKTKSEAHLTLDEVFQTVGIPSIMIPDNATELMEGEFKVFESPVSDSTGGALHTQHQLC
jgi:hypothetical protein